MNLLSEDEQVILAVAAAFAGPQIEKLLIARIVEETVTLFLQTFRLIESTVPS
jgi:hypothetical protein